MKVEQIDIRDIRLLNRISLFCGAALLVAFASCLTGQTATFEQRLKAVMSRPEYRHSRFGVEIYSMEDGKALYSWNAQELFVPGSTTKLLTVGTALESLGPDFRFHTRVYRTGPIKGDVLDGNLVLVASGDPNLSNRIQPDGSMVFENEDHSYDGFPEAKPVPGDPLAVMEEIAEQVKAKGIRKIKGRVFVDASLFPEGAHELGTGVVISPVVVNDNLVDAIITPGAGEGAPVNLSISPQTRYVKILNEIKTGAPGGKFEAHFTKDTAQPDGTHIVTLTGVIPAGMKPRLRVYKVPTPTRYAEIVLAETLEKVGIKISGGGQGDNVSASKRFYTADNQMAEHVSPPLIEEAKITLKVSQNLHASSLPYIVGAYTKKGANDPQQAGFDEEARLLSKAGLDASGAVQNDGAGGAALFSPDFMVHYLLAQAKQPFFPRFKSALPVLGRNGTLFNIQTDAPAAGHVFAKTGTMGGPNALTPEGSVILGKGLAGFIDAKDGRHLAFAAYINFVPFATVDENSATIVGQAVGEIAAAAYDSFSASGSATSAAQQ